MNDGRRRVARHGLRNNVHVDNRTTVVGTAAGTRFRIPCRPNYGTFEVNGTRKRRPTLFKFKSNNEAVCGENGACGKYVFFQCLSVASDGTESQTIELGYVGT